MADERPLAGRTVVTTRERSGRLEGLLADLGARTLHVPLIATEEPADGGAALHAALAEVERYDWVVVTSANGAERVAPALRSAQCRIGVVGTRTAEVIADRAGRGADVVPARHTAADLAAAMPSPPQAERLLLAQADRADPNTAALLRGRGYDVDVITAYRTVLRTPTANERAAMLAADAVAFASGSAAEAWVAAVGTETPPVVAAIGPTTTSVAERLGVKVSVVATDHTLEGLAAAVLHALGTRP